MLRSPLEVPVAKYLEIHQPHADRQQPETKESRQGIQPESCAVRRSTRRHFQPSETFGGSESKPREPPKQYGAGVIARVSMLWSNYRVGTTATGVILAITGAPVSEAASMRSTCPGCGDCNPNLRAITSIRSGSRSEASSNRSA